MLRDDFLEARGVCAGVSRPRADDSVIERVVIHPALLDGLRSHADLVCRYSFAGAFSLRLRAHPSLITCRALPSAKASGGTGSVITEPAAR